MVTESWFRSLWRTSRKHGFDSRNARIGALAFEAASLMSKLLHLWQSLTDKQVARLREEITNSVGIKKLVSEDDERIVRLICIEIMENLGQVARAVVRLSKQCSDPLLRGFEQAYNDLIKIGADTYGWQFTWNKMDKKAKKMERLISTNANLFQEMDTLADLEQTVKRMKGNDDVDSISLVEYEKKVVWKKQELKHLKENSLWTQSYDYTIHLLARSVFTIYGRLGHVFGINHVADVGVTDSGVSDSNYSHRSQSILFTQSSVHPSENSFPRYLSGSLGSTNSMSGPIPRANNVSNFHSGPLGNGNSITASGPISGRRSAGSFYSGPLVRSTEKSAPLPKATKSSRFWQFRDKSSNSKQKISHSKPNRLTVSGPLTGCMIGGINVRVPDVTKDVNTELHPPGNSTHGNLSVGSKNRLLNAPPETLGAAALALHYANIIILIEKLVASPHLIGNEARSDLYNMLPASIRAGLRVKLKPFTKSLSSSLYNTALAGEWNQAMSDILDWLAPLAHNMIRWQSERSFEHHNLVSRTNVLLVQTLYFANQEKTEKLIIELLLGLNYVWRFGREVNARSLVEGATG
ncbi:unnamed protein product [Fraxinus pennsylvanica]|uniref:Uncharacterized protein n=1 Tax=Fraxinus pennsylvanica TaxID=56036 RepID=A0AAD1ZNP2_9LAMI|nr:unnamed protein product [Fraxinus pennsylvanica]